MPAFLGTRRALLTRSALAVLPVTANLQARYRADQGITLTSGKVSQWNDISGNARHLTQGTTGPQPLLSGSAPSGAPAVLFDGTDDQLGPVAFTLNQPCSMYALFKAVTNTGAQRAFDGNNALLTVLFLPLTDKLGIYAGATSQQADSTFPVDTWAVAHWQFNGASSIIRANLVMATTGNAGTQNPGGITIGATSLGLIPANIAVAEHLAYSGTHDSTTQESVIRYLAAYGGVSV